MKESFEAMQRATVSRSFQSICWSEVNAIGASVVMTEVTCSPMVIGSRRK